MSQRSVGNPSRYQTREVIRTCRTRGPIKAVLKEGDAPAPSRDEELQEQLRKQRAVEFSEREPISHRFVSMGTTSERFVDDSKTEATGVMSLAHFKMNEKNVVLRNHLRVAGFTEAQIKRKIDDMEGTTDLSSHGRVKMDPSIVKREMDMMETHLEGLQSKGKQLNNTANVLRMDETERDKVNPGRMDRPSIQTTDIKENGDDLPDFIEPVRLSQILSNKISPEEASSNQMFSTYTKGVPNQVLYIKNIAPETNKSDLIALFLTFQNPKVPLIFKYMTSGRMKGQAFITFPDTESASAALEATHGFKLNGKYILVQFGNRAPSAK